MVSVQLAELLQPAKHLQATKRHKVQCTCISTPLCSGGSCGSFSACSDIQLLAAERQPHIQGSSEPVLAHPLQAPNIAAAFCALLCSPVPRSCWVPGTFTCPPVGPWGKAPHQVNLEKLSTFPSLKKNFHHKHWISTSTKWVRRLLPELCQKGGIWLAQVTEGKSHL